MSCSKGGELGKDQVVRGEKSPLVDGSAYLRLGRRVNKEIAARGGKRKREGTKTGEIVRRRGDIRSPYNRLF